MRMEVSLVALVAIVAGAGLYWRRRRLVERRRRERQDRRKLQRER